MFSQGVQRGELMFVMLVTGCLKGECTIERVALVMNIVPCRDFNLRGLASYSQSYDSTLDIALIKMMCFFLIIR